MTDRAEVGPEIAQFFDQMTLLQWGCDALMIRIAERMLDVSETIELDDLVEEAKVAYALREGISPDAVNDLELARAIDGAVWFVCDPVAYSRHFNERVGSILDDTYVKAS